MLSKGQGKTMGSYHTLLTAMIEDDRLEEAEELWSHLFKKYLASLPRVFYIKMITLYYDKGMHEKMFEVTNYCFPSMILFLNLFTLVMGGCAKHDHTLVPIAP